MSTTTTSDGAKPALRKAVFTKVEQLKPGTSGHNLTVKVLSSNAVLQKGRSVSPHLRQTRISECLVGDETATIIFTARNDQGCSVSYYTFHEKWKEVESSLMLDAAEMVGYV